MFGKANSVKKVKHSLIPIRLENLADRGSLLSSGRNSEALSCPAQVSNLLNLLYRLLCDHELKLSLYLLEFFADSHISTSLLSVEVADLQKMLMAFCGTRRRLNGQSSVGISLIEEMCMAFGRPTEKRFSEGSPSMQQVKSVKATGTETDWAKSTSSPADNLSQKKYLRSKTAELNKEAKRKSEENWGKSQSCKSSDSPSKKKQWMRTKTADLNKQGHNFLTQVNSVQDAAGLNKGHNFLTQVNSVQDAADNASDVVSQKMRYTRSKTRELNKGDPLMALDTADDNILKKMEITRVKSSDGSLPHKGYPRAGTLHLDPTLTNMPSVVPGVPDQLFCDSASGLSERSSKDHVSFRAQLEDSLSTDIAADDRTGPVEASSSGSLIRPFLDAQEEVSTASEVRTLARQPTGFEASLENDESLLKSHIHFADEVPTSKSGSDPFALKDEASIIQTTTLSLSRTFTGGEEAAPQCPKCGHIMEFHGDDDDYLCHVCRKLTCGKHWYCSEHSIGCCEGCSARLKSPQESEQRYSSWHMDVGMSNSLEASEHERVSDSCPLTRTNSVERPEVRWNDELDDLSAMQVRWLATPSDRLVQHPNSTTRMLWDVLVLFFIVLDCTWVPLKLCFTIEGPEWTSLISVSFFALDVLLQFNTGYFHESTLIMRRMMIARNYLRKWFVLDFIATIPWEQISTAFESGQVSAKVTRYMQCARLLRVMKVGQLLERFQELNIFRGRTWQFALSIAEMLCVFGMLCHWAACIFGVLGDPNTFKIAVGMPYDYDAKCVPGGPCEAGLVGAPWRHRYGLDNYSLGTQYLIALHFATGLVTGGELALQPGYSMERVYVVVMMITSLFVCSAFLSEVLVMFTKKAEESIQLSEQDWAVTNFMMLRKVPRELQAKVRRYLEMQTKLKKEGNDYDALDHLSPAIRLELIEHLNRQVICKHPFFAEMSEEALQSTCLQAVPTIFAPGDIVVQKGQLALSMDFIVRGKLKVEGLQDAVYLSAGSWLGDLCLFIDTQRSHTVTALVSSEVLRIHKRVVISVCGEFADMQEHYDLFQTRICEGEAITVCPICKRPGHGEQDCEYNPFRAAKNSVRNSDNHEMDEQASESLAILGMVKQATKNLGKGVESSAARGSEFLGAIKRATIKTFRGPELIRPPEIPITEQASEECELH